VIVAGLRERFPDDGILSEESRDSADRLSRERVWIVDPLDGTREFIDGIPEFAVMIGLAVNGAAVLGVVYCAASDELYMAAAGGGAWLESGGRLERLRTEPAGESLRLVGSRSHPDARLLRIRDELGIDDVRPSGSVGVKCALIARNERDLYVHPVPYLKEWDTCAPEVILREAGGTVCDCLGEPLRYNKPKPVQPNGILAGAPGVLPRVLDVVRTAFVEDPAEVPARS
jgi:3'(2'), 5'-bisphosphate nucleotidase